jgi:AcrR family transcriptional regulator
MASKQRREREKTELRARIMDAARDIFAREGFEAVSMRRIAEAIEYSPTAIYAHFEDKEDLFRQICMDDFDRYQQTQAAAMAVADPVARIVAMGKTYIRFAIEHPNHFRRMFLDPPFVTPSEEQLARKGDPSQDGYAAFRGTVAEAIAAKRFRAELGDDVDLLTQTLWAAVHGVAAILVVHSNDKTWVELQPAEKLIETTVHGILHGLLARDGGAK